VPISLVACLALALLLLPSESAAQAGAPPGGDTGGGAVRLFLDCSYFCDEAFLKREITLVDWVRDRADADVHVLVTRQATGGGGSEHTLKFIGLGRFAGVEQTLRYVSANTSTSDEIRRGLAEALKRGLVRYVADTPMGEQLKITFAQTQPGAAQADARKDPWNLWVFRTNVGGSLDGERATRSRSVRGSASASRTTDDWRLWFSASGRYNSNTFELSETESFRSLTRNADAAATVVRSLTSHWSAGFLATASTSTFLNYDFRARLAPGVEYNVFPYAESSRRMLVTQYTVGLNRFDYREETIFGRTEENLADHRLGTSLSLRQPWGTASGSVDFTQYLSMPDKYRLSAYGSTSVRLFKGFSYNVFGSVSRTADQINIRRAGATPEEILVRQRQLASRYTYFLNFGITYSFGSIFNNIVNPRFGGGGGGGVVFID
jgi:hypothetical protein